MLVRPSVRPSAVAFLQHFSSTRVLQFNKCYVGNAIHRRLHCVVLSPVHLQNCKGYQTLNSPYSTTRRVNKKQDTIGGLLPSVTSPAVNRFSKFFTVRLSGKFLTMTYLNTPPPPKRVATLPCEISVFKKSHCSRSK